MTPSRRTSLARRSISAQNWLNRGRDASRLEEQGRRSLSRCSTKSNTRNTHVPLAKAAPMGRTNRGTKSRTLHGGSRTETPQQRRSEKRAATVRSSPSTILQRPSALATHHSSIDTPRTALELSQMPSYPLPHSRFGVADLSRVGDSACSSRATEQFPNTDVFSWISPLDQVKDAAPSGNSLPSGKSVTFPQSSPEHSFSTTNGDLLYADWPQTLGESALGSVQERDGARTASLTPHSRRGGQTAMSLSQHKISRRVTCKRALAAPVSRISLAPTQKCAIGTANRHRGGDFAQTRKAPERRTLRWKKRCTQGNWRQSKSRPSKWNGCAEGISRTSACALRSKEKRQTVNRKSLAVSRGRHSESTYDSAYIRPEDSDEVVRISPVSGVHARKTAGKIDGKAYSAKRVKRKSKIPRNSHLGTKFLNQYKDNDNVTSHNFLMERCHSVDHTPRHDVYPPSNECDDERSLFSPLESEAEYNGHPHRLPINHSPEDARSRDRWSSDGLEGLDAQNAQPNTVDEHLVSVNHPSPLTDVVYQAKARLNSDSAANSYAPCLGKQHLPVISNVGGTFVEFASGDSVSRPANEQMDSTENATGTHLRSTHHTTASQCATFFAQNNEINHVKCTFVPRPMRERQNSSASNNSVSPAQDMLVPHPGFRRRKSFAPNMRFSSPKYEGSSTHQKDSWFQVYRQQRNAPTHGGNSNMLTSFLLPEDFQSADCCTSNMPFSFYPDAEDKMTNARTNVPTSNDGPLSVNRDSRGDPRNDRAGAHLHKPTNNGCAFISRPSEKRGNFASIAAAQNDSPSKNGWTFVPRPSRNQGSLLPSVLAQNSEASVPHFGYRQRNSDDTAVNDPLNAYSQRGEALTLHVDHRGENYTGRSLNQPKNASAYRYAGHPGGTSDEIESSTPRIAHAQSNPAFHPHPAYPLCSSNDIRVVAPLNALAQNGEPSVQHADYCWPKSGGYKMNAPSVACINAGVFAQPEDPGDSKSMSNTPADTSPKNAVCIPHSGYLQKDACDCYDSTAMAPDVLGRVPSLRGRTSKAFRVTPPNTATDVPSKPTPDRCQANTHKTLPANRFALNPDYCWSTIANLGRVFMEDDAGPSSPCATTASLHSCTNSSQYAQHASPPTWSRTGKQFQGCPSPSSAKLLQGAISPCAAPAPSLSSSVAPRTIYAREQPRDQHQESKRWDKSWPDVHPVAKRLPCSSIIDATERTPKHQDSREDTTTKRSHLASGGTGVNLLRLPAPGCLASNRRQFALTSSSSLPPPNTGAKLSVHDRHSRNLHVFDSNAEERSKQYNSIDDSLLAKHADVSAASVTHHAMTDGQRSASNVAARCDGNQIFLPAHGATPRANSFQRDGLACGDGRALLPHTKTAAHVNPCEHGLSGRQTKIDYLGKPLSENKSAKAQRASALHERCEESATSMVQHAFPPTPARPSTCGSARVPIRYDERFAHYTPSIRSESTLTKRQPRTSSRRAFLSSRSATFEEGCERGSPLGDDSRQLRLANATADFDATVVVNGKSIHRPDRVSCADEGSNVQRESWHGEQHRTNAISDASRGVALHEEMRLGVRLKNAFADILYPDSLNPGDAMYYGANSSEPTYLLQQIYRGDDALRARTALHACRARCTKSMAGALCEHETAKTIKEAALKMRGSNGVPPEIIDNAYKESCDAAGMKGVDTSPRNSTRDGHCGAAGISLLSQTHALRANDVLTGTLRDDSVVPGASTLHTAPSPHGAHTVPAERRCEANSRNPLQHETYETGGANQQQRMRASGIHDALGAASNPYDAFEDPLQHVRRAKQHDIRTGRVSDEATAKSVLRTSAPDVEGAQVGTLQRSDTDKVNLLHHAHAFSATNLPVADYRESRYPRNYSFLRLDENDATGALLHPGDATMTDQGSRVHATNIYDVDVDLACAERNDPAGRNTVDVSSRNSNRDGNCGAADISLVSRTHALRANDVYNGTLRSDSIVSGASTPCTAPGSHGAPTMPAERRWGAENRDPLQHDTYETSSVGQVRRMRASGIHDAPLVAPSPRDALEDKVRHLHRANQHDFCSGHASDEATAKSVLRTRAPDVEGAQVGILQRRDTDNVNPLNHAHTFSATNLPVANNRGHGYPKNYSFAREDANDATGAVLHQGDAAMADQASRAQTTNIYGADVDLARAERNDAAGRNGVDASPWNSTRDGHCRAAGTSLLSKTRALRANDVHTGTSRDDSVVPRASAPCTAPNPDGINTMPAERRWGAACSKPLQHDTYASSDVDQLQRMRTSGIHDAPGAAPYPRHAFEDPLQHVHRARQHDMRTGRVCDEATAKSVLRTRAPNVEGAQVGILQESDTDNVNPLHHAYSCSAINLPVVIERGDRYPRIFSFLQKDRNGASGSLLHQSEAAMADQGSRAHTTNIYHADLDFAYAGTNDAAGRSGVDANPRNSTRDGHCGAAGTSLLSRTHALHANDVLTGTLRGDSVVPRASTPRTAPSRLGRITMPAEQGWGAEARKSLQHETYETGDVDQLQRMRASGIYDAPLAAPYPSNAFKDALQNVRFAKQRDIHTRRVSEEATAKSVLRTFAPDIEGAQVGTLQQRDNDNVNPLHHAFSTTNLPVADDQGDRRPKNYSLLQKGENDAPGALLHQSEGTMANQGSRARTINIYDADVDLACAEKNDVAGRKGVDVSSRNSTHNGHCEATDISLLSRTHTLLNVHTGTLRGDSVVPQASLLHTAPNLHGAPTMLAERRWWGESRNPLPRATCETSGVDQLQRKRESIVHDAPEAASFPRDAFEDALQYVHCAKQHDIHTGHVSDEATAKSILRTLAPGVESVQVGTLQQSSTDDVNMMNRTRVLSASNLLVTTDHGDRYHRNYSFLQADENDAACTLPHQRDAIKGDSHKRARTANIYDADIGTSDTLHCAFSPDISGDPIAVVTGKSLPVTDSLMRSRAPNADRGSSATLSEYDASEVTRRARGAAQRQHANVPNMNNAPIVTCKRLDSLGSNPPRLLPVSAIFGPPFPDARGSHPGVEMLVRTGAPDLDLLATNREGYHDEDILEPTNAYLLPPTLSRTQGTCLHPACYCPNTADQHLPPHSNIAVCGVHAPVVGERPSLRSSTLGASFPEIHLAKSGDAYCVDGNDVISRRSKRRSIASLRCNASSDTAKLSTCSTPWSSLSREPSINRSDAIVVADGDSESLLIPTHAAKELTTLSCHNADALRLLAPELVRSDDRAEMPDAETTYRGSNPNNVVRASAHSANYGVPRTRRCALYAVTPGDCVEELGSALLTDPHSRTGYALSLQHKSVVGGRPTKQVCGLTTSHSCPQLKEAGIDLRKNGKPLFVQVWLEFSLLTKDDLVMPPPPPWYVPGTCML